MPTPPTRHIPFSRREVLEMLAAGGVVPPGEEKAFRDFAAMLSAVFHHEVHDVVERLKDFYRPHSPDADFLPLRSHSAPTAAAEFVDSFEKLLNQANYARLSRAEVAAAYQSSAILDIAVRVRHEDFEDDRFYVRGAALHERLERPWFGLRSRRVTFEVYDRVVLFVRFKAEDAHFAAGRQRLACRPGTIAIKLFKSVPKADLEVLYPGLEVSMRVKDKLVLGGLTLVGGMPLLGKLNVVLTVIFALIAGFLGYEGVANEDLLKQAMASLAAAVALGSFAFQRWASYQNQRDKFHRHLSQNLYFRSLANNEAVMLQVADSAEEEDVKEMLLAYAFMLTASEQFLPDVLDQAIEAWFREGHACELAFECPDALGKLARFGLVHTAANGQLLPLPLADALVRLDTMWDDIFRFARDQR
jgi:hypothetical protein